jgi:PAS domain S-box-containing protein
MVQQSPLAVIEWNRNFEVEDWNPAAEKIFGYSKEEAMGRHVAGLIIPEEIKAAIDGVMQDLVKQQGGTRSTNENITKDGRTIVCEWYNTPLIDETGEVIGVTSLAQDITERVRLEEEIRESLERREQQVALSTEVAQEIAAAPALDDLFRQVVELVQERFDYYHAHVYTLAEEDLVMQEGTGQAGRRMKADGHKIPLAAEQSLVARAARRGEPVLVPDVTQESGWLPNPLLPETKSEIAVPIKLGDQLLGVLDVQDEEVGSLTEEDQLLLVGLCGQIAVAINNRRIEAERRQIEETLQLTQISVDQSTDSIFWITPEAELLFVNEGACQNLGYTKEELTSLTVHDVDPNFTREIWPHHWHDLKEKRSMVVETEHQAKDGRLIPVEVRITYLKFMDKEYNFATARDITERKQAEAELEARLHELSALQRLMSREGWQEFQATRSEGAPGYLFDQTALRPVTRDELNVAAGNGQPEPGSPAPKGATTHPVTKPLSISGETIGTLGVFDDPDQPLSLEEQAFFEAVATQIAEALERARLLEQSQSSLSETEQLYSISQRLNQASDLQELVAVVAESGLLPHINRVMLFGFEYNEAGQGETANILANWYSGQGKPPTVVGTQYLWPMFSKFKFLLAGESKFSGDILEDEKIDPASGAMLRRSKVRAVALLPLWSGSRQVGALVLESEEPYRFTEREKRTYAALARQVAVAVENRRLFEETRRALAEVEATQRRYTVQAWESYRARQVAKSHEQVREGTPPFNGQLPPGVKQAVAQKRAVATGTPLLPAPGGEESPASPDTGASLIVPLTVRDQIIGVLGLQETDERAWTPEELALVEAIGEQLAQAADQLRLFDETQQQAARERRAGEIGDKIRAAQSLEEALQIAAKEVGLSLKAPQTTVQLDVE